GPVMAPAYPTSFLENGSRERPAFMAGFSFLAGRAEIRRALPHHAVADFRRAHAAGFAGAVIDVQLLREVAGRTVRLREVTQRRPARDDRLLQDRLDGFRQPRVLGTRDAAGGAAGADAGKEQRLA